MPFAGIHECTAIRRSVVDEGGDRIHHRGIKIYHPIVLLRGCALHIPTQAKIERKFRGRLPIVLQVKAVVNFLVMGQGVNAGCAVCSSS